MKVLDILTAPWAIIPERKFEIDAIYATHLRGEKIDITAVEAQLGRPLNNQPQGYEVENGVAIIALDGVIAKRMNLFTQISGGTSTQLIGNQLRQALDDPTVTAILLHTDSPGGSVDGTQELADAIFAARDQKPIVAFADGLMASAAYWIGSAASRVYAASDTTQIGSIGVVATHVDVSSQENRFGVKTTEITAGKYKRIASQYAPLTPEGRQSIQDQVDYLYGLFLDAVAQNRDVESVDGVHETMADGRLFFGQQAVDVGLVDGVSTLEQLMTALANGEIDIPASKGTRTVVSVPAAIVPHKTAGNAVVPNPIQQENNMPLTREQFVAENPDLAAAIRAEGETAGVAQGKTQGADAERTRIQAVFEQSMPGHEALIKQLAFDGKTTGPEAAVAVLNAERSKRVTTQANLTADAPKPAPSAIPPEPKAENADEDAIDPKVVARQARTYQAEQLALGNRITAADAVAHVTKKEK